MLNIYEKLIKIERFNWEKYLIIPNEFLPEPEKLYWNGEWENKDRAFINKIADSMKIEKFANSYGDICFNDRTKVSDFLLAYGNFFEKEFIDEIVNKAYDTINAKKFNSIEAQFGVDNEVRIIGEYTL